MAAKVYFIVEDIDMVQQTLWCDNSNASHEGVFI